MILYLLLANLYLAAFYTFYHLLLRKETFFRLNRYYLLGSMFLSFTLPLANIPIGGQYMGQLAGQVVGQVTERIMGKVNPVTGEDAAETQTATARQGQGFAGEINSPSFWAIGSVLSGDTPLAEARATTGRLAGIVQLYVLGCLLSFLIFLFRMVQTGRAFRGTDAKPGAFSFFHLVCVNKDLEGYAKILQHEYVHAREWHSLDIMLVQVLRIFNWFNPFVYALERAFRLQHEYLADNLASGQNRTGYAELLLATALQTSPYNLNNQFINPSLLKSRIMMLLKNETPKRNLAKLTLMLPMILGMVVLATACNRSGKNTTETNPEARPDRTEVDQRISDVRAAAADRQQDSTAGAAKTIPAAIPPPAPKRDTTKQRPQKPVMNSIDGKSRILSKEDTLRITPKDTAQSIQQEQTVREHNETEIPPIFTGADNTQGLQAFREWVYQNLVIPKEALDAGYSGLVLVKVSFIIDQYGKLTDIKMDADPGYGLKEAITTVLEKSPDWKPGIQNGKPVRVSYTVPIRIQIVN